MLITLILTLSLLSIASSVENCARFNSQGVCVECNVGLIAFSNKCVPVIPHCLEFSLNYTCTLCESGY